MPRDGVAIFSLPFVADASPDVATKFRLASVVIQEALLPPSFLDTPSSPFDKLPSVLRSSPFCGCIRSPFQCLSMEEGINVGVGYIRIPLDVPSSGQLRVGYHEFEGGKIDGKQSGITLLLFRTENVS